MMRDSNRGDMEADRNEDESDDGVLDRRKFVAGMSALGVGGAAGCLGDDGGSDGTPGETATPTDATTGTEPATGTTTTGPGTDTGTPTQEPSEGLEPVPRNLVYQYFEGGFSEMPNFDSLAPAGGGELDGGTMSTDVAEREENFAIAFEGELVIGGRLPAGTYTFAADASDAVTLYINGNEFLEATDGAVEQGVRLQEGVQEFRVEYLHTTGSSQLGVGWRGTYDELLPRLAETDPFRTDLGIPMEYQGSTDPSLEIDVGTRPRTKRIQMSGASAKALAVGMPDLTNYCFDPATGGVKYAWTGAFINYGPIINYGSGRGDNPADVLGLRFPMGGMDYPLRVGDADAEPDVEFQGCREAPHPPELWYTVDGHEVTHTVEGVSGSLGVTHTVGFEEAPSGMVYFHTGDGDDVTREATEGEWNDDTLEVPAGVEEFSVTITARRV
jgi:hypothetical protein